LSPQVACVLDQVAQAFTRSRYSLDEVGAAVTANSKRVDGASAPRRLSSEGNYFVR